MRNRLVTLTAAIALILFGADQASAGYEFRFADSSGAYQTAFTLDFGVSPTLDIQVYLVATGGTALDDLRSYGVQLNYNGTIADVLNTSDIASNPAFTQADVKAVQAGSVVSDFARTADATPAAGPYVASSSGPDGDPRILLATFTFTGINNGVTAAVTADPFPSFNTVTGTTNTALDLLIANGSATITVANVPEPGTLLLSGFAALCMTGGAWYRRRQAR